MRRNETVALSSFGWRLQILHSGTCQDWAQSQLICCVDTHHREVNDAYLCLAARLLGKATDVLCKHEQRVNESIAA